MNLTLSRNAKINNCFIKGQIISKGNCRAVNSFKKRMNEFISTTMRRVFFCFLEEIEDSKKAFRNYLTFRDYLNIYLVLSFTYMQFQNIHKLHTHQMVLESLIFIILGFKIEKNSRGHQFDWSKNLNFKFIFETLTWIRTIETNPIWIIIFLT